MSLLAISIQSISEVSEQLDLADPPQKPSGNANAQAPQDKTSPPPKPGSTPEKKEPTKSSEQTPPGKAAQEKTHTPPAKPVVGEASKKDDPGQDAPGKKDEVSIPPSKLDVAPAPQINLPGIPAPAPVKPREPFRIGTMLEPALWLIAALGLGALAIAWVKRYQKQQDMESRDTAHDQLAKFRQAVQDGEMTNEEFRKVKELLAEKIRNPVQRAADKPNEGPTGGPLTATSEPTA